MTRKDFIPFGKPNFSQKEIDAVEKVIKSGWVGMGPETLKFEKELAEYLNAPYVVTVNSCTNALFLSLLTSGISSGDEVICPSLTWCSTANVALFLGAKPVFCDVDPNTLCITPESIKKKLSSKTKAVIVVHFGGLAVEVENIRKIIPDHVVIIEDAAHALGSKFKNGKPIGSSGNLTCFSFYANKNLSTGEGGAIALFDEEVANKLRSLRQHSLPLDAWKRFTHKNSLVSSELTELGYKMNYIDLLACIGRIQLERQSEFYQYRLNIANQYYKQLHKLEPLIGFQSNILDQYHARHLFVIMLDETKFSRDEVLLDLRSRNIGVSIHYSPLHLMRLYPSEKQQILPNTERICRQNMTLPISASMTIEDADYIVKQIIELIE